MVSKKNYKQANVDWLTEKSKEEGVNSLGRGIYYKVLKESETKDIHPTPRSIVSRKTSVCISPKTIYIIGIPRFQRNDTKIYISNLTFFIAPK